MENKTKKAIETILKYKFLDEKNGTNKMMASFHNGLSNYESCLNRQNILISFHKMQVVQDEKIIYRIKYKYISGGKINGYKLESVN